MFTVTPLKFKGGKAYRFGKSLTHATSGNFPI